MNDDSQPPMTRHADDRLTEILTVERIEDNFFRGIETPNGEGRMFGGQVLGQALMAATHTVEGDRVNHSLHGYFMRAGDATKPVLYRVERDMDGRSFNTRRVVAIQNGQPILNLAASFQVQEEGMHHASAMPEDMPEPEDLLDEQGLAEKYPDKVPEMVKRFLKAERPIEVRPCRLGPPYDMEPFDGESFRWIKARVPMPDDKALHRAALVYASDMGLLGVALGVHGVGFFSKGMRFASLDHAMWMHDDFRMDEWLLFGMQSPWTGGGRGLTHGRIFTRDGRLVATLSQEGMLRRKS
jgi:acyl-CoA thioesterase-2